MERTNYKAFSSNGIDTANRGFEGAEDRNKYERGCAVYAALGADKSGVGAGAGIYNKEDSSGSSIKVGTIGLSGKFGSDGIGIANDATILKAEYVPEGHGIGASVGVDVSSKAVISEDEFAF